MSQMAGRGTFFVPTLTVYVYHRESASPHVRARAGHLYSHHVASVRRALELGVPIAAGTDAGGHGHPKNALELQYLVEAGLTPMQALRAATQWAAQCLGLGREVGTIEKGRLADLVVVDGNPLDDVTMLLDPARIELVLKGGTVCVDRRRSLAS
jgi:imidazolonepropionase-like amidohydrolase